MNDWLTIQYAGTEQTGPASAINAVAKDLEKHNVPFVVWNYNVEDNAPVKTRRTTKKKVADVDLEVRGTK